MLLSKNLVVWRRGNGNSQAKVRNGGGSGDNGNKKNLGKGLKCLFEIMDASRKLGCVS